MKTLQQQRDSIWTKINQIERMEKEQSKIDMKTTDERGFLLNLSEYLSIDKKINYAKGSALRMIKKLLKRIYGEDWYFGTNYDYIEAVKEFKKFIN